MKLTAQTPLCLPHLTMLDASPVELVRAAADNGFRYVSMRLVPTMTGEARHPMEVGSPMFREVDATMRANGVGIVDIEAIWLRPETRISDYEAALDAAGALGAKCFQVIGNDPDEARLIDNLAQLCEVGASRNLQMALEFMMFSQVRSLKAARKVIESTGKVNATLVLDTLHFFRCGVAMEELSSVPEDRVGVVQICDAPLISPPDYEAMLHEARFDRRLPGLGDFPVARWLDALPDTPLLSVEVPQPANSLSPSERAKVLKDGMDRFVKSLLEPNRNR